MALTLTLRVLTTCGRATAATVAVAACCPPASRTEALAGHAYCLPVVRELPNPVVDPAALLPN